MDLEQNTASLPAVEPPVHHFGTQVPYAPIRWGMENPPRATLLQKCLIVGAAFVGFALMVASVLERL
jgi:hypothetical protein